MLIVSQFFLWGNVVFNTFITLESRFIGMCCMECSMEWVVGIQTNIFHAHATPATPIGLTNIYTVR